MIIKSVSKSNFESYLPKAISICSNFQPRFLDSNISRDQALLTAGQHLKNALNYTLPGGKMTRWVIIMTSSWWVWVKGFDNDSSVSFNNRSRMLRMVRSRTSVGMGSWASSNLFFSRWWHYGSIINSKRSNLLV